MTLDPVHFDGIARLANRIDTGADDRDHRKFAETVWNDFLDPLTDARGRVILEPVDEVTRYRVDREEVALQEAPFPTVHGLDAGTINPTTFRNGLVLDVAQAAMSATPSDLEVHRSRTVVATVHASDAAAKVDDRWVTFDEGYSRSRAVKIPPVQRFAEGIVHALALYLAESTHALEHADQVEDLLLLDGPLYPRRPPRWADQHPDLEDFLLEDPRPAAVLADYIELIETLADRDIPVVGFVKNPGTSVLTRALKADAIAAPWPNDAAFFRRVLETGETVSDVDGGTRWRRDTSTIAYTGWFHSRGGVDRPLSAEGDALGNERRLDPTAYEVTFFVIYDPRADLCYRVEAPALVTADEEQRRAIARQVLRSVAATAGPPKAIEKADELARISASEKASLRETLETRFETTRDRTYDDHRWGEEGL
ncbi:MAG: DNA double-strand break repair nuclease NurA [Natrialbaceae archaeon]|nr:DNA double-strand break repair nuclease NurA [Natrialbaceae archaeon]